MEIPRNRTADNKQTNNSHTKHVNKEINDQSVDSEDSKILGVLKCCNWEVAKWPNVTIVILTDFT